MTSLDRHTDYGGAGLDAADLGGDPIAAVARWLRGAEDAGLEEPNAMVLATVDASGTPTGRTVLLKGIAASGFDFVTNMDSAKGRAIAANPAVSLVFPWYLLRRQVVIEGTAAVAGAAVSDAYFRARPRGSQLAAWASAQSEPIASREALEARVREAERRHPEPGEVPRPPRWGAYRVAPTSIEFWQGRSSRLHDRIRFRRSGDAWIIERLQP